MSEKYKDALNKIVVSDELKEKIIAKATLKETIPPAATRHNTRRPRYFYLRHYAGLAACFLICASAVFTGKYVYSPDINPVPDITPVDETPVDSVSEADNQSGYTDSDTDASINYNDSSKHNTVSIVSPDNRNINTAPINSPINNVFPSGSAVSGNPPADTANIDNNAVSVESIGDNSDNNIYESGDLSKINNDTLVQGSLGDNSDLVVNPIYSAENIEELQKQVGYIFKLPQYIPDGYTIGECGALFGSLIEINYNSADNNILYRTEKTDGDVSGDYNEYERVETEIINNTKITIKGENNLYYNAVWNDDCAYALNIENGIDKETIIKIAESVDYPKGETTELFNDEISNAANTEVNNTLEVLEKNEKENDFFDSAIND